MLTMIPVFPIAKSGELRILRLQERLGVWQEQESKSKSREDLLKSVNSRVMYKVRKHGFCIAKRGIKEGSTTDSYILFRKT